MENNTIEEYEIRANNCARKKTTKTFEEQITIRRRPTQNGVEIETTKWIDNNGPETSNVSSISEETDTPVITEDAPDTSLISSSHSSKHMTYKHSSLQRVMVKELKMFPYKVHTVHHLMPAEIPNKPMTSISRHSTHMTITRTSMQRVMINDMQKFPYKVQTKQQLMPMDHQALLNNALQNFKTLTDDFRSQFVLSDEAFGHLNRHLSQHNLRFSNIDESFTGPNTFGSQRHRTVNHKIIPFSSVNIEEQNQEGTTHSTNTVINPGTFDDDMINCFLQEQFGEQFGKMNSDLISENPEIPSFEQRTSKMSNAIIPWRTRKASKPLCERTENPIDDAPSQDEVAIIPWRTRKASKSLDENTENPTEDAIITEPSHHDELDNNAPKVNDEQDEAINNEVAPLIHAIDLEEHPDSMDNEDTPSNVTNEDDLAKDKQNTYEKNENKILLQTKDQNFKEKDSGKVVLYTTSMGIIRDTYAKCSNVKKILRTLLVKFEERDVFMSVEYQQEIKERMHSDIIKVPQLYVEGQHIGDADTVERLNETGELRQLLKPYKSISTTYTCQTCGGYRLLPCPSCNGSKKSVHRNHFTAEFVALKCMNCDEVGLVKCHNC